MFLICRYARAERDLKQARPFGEGAKKFYEVAEITPAGDNNKELLVAMTSDRGKDNNGIFQECFFCLF